MKIEIIINGRTEFFIDNATKIGIEPTQQGEAVEIKIFVKRESEKFNYMAHITGYIDIEDYKKNTQIIIR